MINKENNKLSIPKSINKFSEVELNDLAKKIRNFMIEKNSFTGGHIGANLGTVELTIALHKVFKSPQEPLLFDTGHQGYTHKILTGRSNLFSSLNKYGGMNRFLSPKESTHDIMEASHAGTAISVGLGIAKTRYLKKNNKPVVVVVGDSALAEGSSWEALNHAAVEDVNLIIIINDNGYAISPGFGGLHNLLSSDFGNAPQFFESLGFKYDGPVDGHNFSELVPAFERAKENPTRQIIHVKTVKGYGWEPAKKHPYKAHFSMPFNPDDGSLKEKVTKSYPDEAASCIEEMMEINDKIVCITPSTLYATGLNNVFHKFPDRSIDPGMEEQHAMSMTVGIATEGYYPIVAFQSTFLQRAFDQLIHDVCFADLPVMVLSTRSGFSGYDNPTHHGIYDISFTQSFPNLTVLYPKDGHELTVMIRQAQKKIKGPVLIMMPYGPVNYLDTVEEKNVLAPELIYDGDEILIVTVGNKFIEAEAAAKKINAGLINLRIINPLPGEFLLKAFKSYKKIVTVEEAVLNGGVGSSIASLLTDNQTSRELLRLGLPKKFIEPGSNAELSKVYKLDAEGIIGSILERWGKD